MNAPKYTPIIEDGASQRRETCSNQTADPSARVETLGRDDKSEGVESVGGDDKSEGVEAAGRDDKSEGVEAPGQDDNQNESATAGAPPSSPAVGGRVGSATPNPVKLCLHVKEDGFFCGRPALTDRLYCYQHLRLRGQQMRMARARAQRLACPLMLPALDDLNAVRVALTQVSYALTTGQLEQRRAGLLLYALQQAATNLWRIELIQMNTARSPQQSQPATEVDQQKRRVEEYPGFEAEFGLPAGLDLATPPEVLFPPPKEETTAQSTPKRHPHPAWIAEDIALEQLDKQKSYMSEKTYNEQSRKIHDRLHKKAHTELRKEQEAEYAAEAERRNAAEEEKARLFNSMDAGQQRAYHLGVITGYKAREEAEEKAPERKPVASGDACVPASGERSNLA